jgi:hypothetical protein
VAVGFAELRNRFAAILAVEEREPTDWLEVERLASQLQRELPIDATSEAVHRYLDDADIPSRDDAYTAKQRQQVRRYVDLGEYDDGIPVPWWGCALVLLAGASVVKWLLLLVEAYGLPADGQRLPDGGQAFDGLYPPVTSLAPTSPSTCSF